MSFFQKIKEKFNKKTEKKIKINVQSNLGLKIKKINKKHTKINDDYFTELEELLLNSDLGVELSFDFLDKIKTIVNDKKIKDIDEINEILADIMIKFYLNNQEINVELNENKDGPTVILVVGVNGVGKTTNIAKLAYKYQQENKKVLLVAGDTFRAAGASQLEEWGERLKIEVVRGNQGADPSSVYFQGAKKAIDEKYDVLICDSAGRLQNKDNLMEELAKMKRVLSKQIQDAPHEVILVIDATTGQNGILQSEKFLQSTGVDSILLSKLDGTSKGGIIFAIKNKFNIPVKLIGVGEKGEDLKSFDINEYVYSLMGEEYEND